MKRYKVIAGACVCGPQQAILNFGDEKDADFFQPGQAEELVQRKFLVEVEPADSADADADKKAADEKKAAGKKGTGKKATELTDPILG